MEKSEVNKAFRALFDEAIKNYTRPDFKMYSCSDADSDSYPKQGEFVCAGLNGNVLNNDYTHQFGYVVQVRKRRGAFGSAQVFIREYDGGLMCHENNSYYRLTPDQEREVRTYFTVVSPETEQYEIGYSLRDKEPEIGFLIEE